MNKFLVKAAKITGLKWSPCSWSRNAGDNLRSGYQEKKMIEIDVDVPCLNTNKMYWQEVKLKWRNCYVFRQQHPYVAWDSGKEGTTRTGNQEQEQEQEPFKAQANFLMKFTLTWCLIYTLTGKLKVVSWGDVLSYYRLVLDFKRTASCFYKLAKRVFKISHHFYTLYFYTFKSSSLHLFP